jgi:hypothetical protein
MRTMMESEIAATAERISKARDACPADARAMLRQIDHDHGRDTVRAVIAQMQRLSECRHTEAMAVFAGLPPMPFGDALRIKRERGDVCALGWTPGDGGVYSKTTRCR